ncbi:MAG TPA: hypothetical protein VFB72_19960 [Verrucomicrobiae bacterium]|nr:hypothetical protein [Verrucomicrobiae bacterium]
MDQTLRVINQMQADGVIGPYAIGGAIAATFYLEPTSTFDLDIFISFNKNANEIVNLGPIYEYLKQRGYKPKGQYITIEGWDVEFLPADDQLYNEALSKAQPAQIHGVNTYVMTPEYLMTIALKTGRPKDFIRLDQFIQAKSYDADKLRDVLARNGLLQKWEKFNVSYAERTK